MFPGGTCLADYVNRSECFTRAASIGALDTSFNGGATLNLDITPAQDDGPIDFGRQYVGISNDCKYLFSEYNGTGTNHKVFKVTPAGALDTTFATAGILTAATGVATFPGGLTVLQNGSFYTFNYYAGSIFRISKFNADATVDTTYGTAGISNISYGGYTSPTSLIVSRLEEAYIVLDKRYVIKIKSNGTLDTSYGTAGVATTTLNSAAALGGTVQIDKAGRIYVGGTNGTNDSMITRLLPSGQIDTSFGTAGSVNQDITYYDGDSSINSIHIGCDGTIYASGFPTQNAGGSTNQFVLKYNTNGVLDTSFGTGGLAISSSNGRHPNLKFFFALDRTTNKLLMGGQNSGFVNTQLTRLNSDGSTDTTFGTAGIFQPTNIGNPGFYYVQNGKTILYGNTAGTVLNLIGID
jgi:uncharacterized delta-60 repeat protein